MSQLTSRGVIADGKVRGDTRCVLETTRIGTVVGVAADVGGRLPHDLSEMSPPIQVVVVRLASVGGVVGFFWIV